MKHKHLRSWMAALAVGLTLAACNNGDDSASTSAGLGADSNTSMGPAQTTLAPGSDTASGVNSATSNPPTMSTTKRKGRVSSMMTTDDSKVKVEMDKSGYYSRSEVAPLYSGGQSSLDDYINDNIVYPQNAIDNNVEGTVNVQFVVDEKGNITNVKTLGNKLGYGLEEEAVKVISKMPKWTAGTVKGKAVKTWRMLPITYKLES